MTLSDSRFGSVRTSMVWKWVWNLYKFLKMGMFSLLVIVKIRSRNKYSRGKRTFWSECVRLTTGRPIFFRNNNPSESFNINRNKAKFDRASSTYYFIDLSIIPTRNFGRDSWNFISVITYQGHSNKSVTLVTQSIVTQVVRACMHRGHFMLILLQQKDNFHEKI